MKKILFLSLFISLKMLGQAAKIDAVVGASENGNAIVGVLKNTNPTDNYNAISGSNNSTNSFGFGVQGIHAGGGSGVYGSSQTGNGVTGFSALGRGISGLNNGIGGVGGYFNSTNGFALITGSGRVGIGISNPTAQLDVVRGTAPDGTAIFRGTTHVSHFNYSTNEDTYIRGGKNGSNVYINDIAGLGNVGVGTSSPQAKLHVAQGNLRVDNLAGSGNVQVYADNLGTIQATLPVAFSVKSNVSLIPIANATVTTAPFNTENYDLPGFYDNSIYEFNAPINGIYHFDSAVTFGIVNSAFASSICTLSILVDGSTSAISTQAMVVGGYKTLNLSQDIKLNAGQKVKISVYQNSGGSISLVGFDNSFFTGSMAIRL